MIDGVLYTGWSDGTFKARTYNGTTFGAASNVNLNGLTARADCHERLDGDGVRQVDRSPLLHRRGRTRMFYRYFLPESRVLGAVRFDGPASGNGINFANASGMFIDAGRLFVGDSTTGQLRRVAWSGGAMSGTASVISGPAVDGNDWRARGSFILAP